MSSNTPNPQAGSPPKGQRPDIENACADHRPLPRILSDLLVSWKRSDDVKSRTWKTCGAFSIMTSFEILFNVLCVVLKCV